MTPLIINADDYALSPAVDDAVLHLNELGVVTSTSAMVLSAAWPHASKRLSGSRLDCGLHLDFTSPFAQQAGCGYGLGALLARTYMRLVDRSRVLAAIDHQLDRFEEHAGRAPRFIDGHQHVHQLPVVRSALAEAIEKRYGAGRTSVAVRSCVPRRWQGGKAAVVAALGGHAWARMQRARQWQVNSDFVGVYSFAPDADLPALWSRWLASAQGPMPMVMCHVARPNASADPDDEIHAARLREYAWLSAPAFKDLCALHGMVPSRWPST